MKRRAGGQPGNQNAKGNSGGRAPLRNRNAEKHGGYSKVNAGAYTEEEKELVQFMFPGDEAMLEEEIILFTIRERRIMKAINKYMDGSDQAVLTVTQSEHQRTFDGTEEEQAQQKADYKEIIRQKVKDGERLPGRDVVVTTTTENSTNIILRLERELTSVQGQKCRAINALAQIRLARRKQEGESKGGDFVREWVNAIMKTRK